MSSLLYQNSDLFIVHVYIYGQFKRWHRRFIRSNVEGNITVRITPSMKNWHKLTKERHTFWEYMSFGQSELNSEKKKVFTFKLTWTKCNNRYTVIQKHFSDYKFFPQINSFVDECSKGVGQLFLEEQYLAEYYQLISYTLYLIFSLLVPSRTWPLLFCHFLHPDISRYIIRRYQLLFDKYVQ